MYLDELINNVRIEVQDIQGESFSYDTIKRAIMKSLGLMGRLIPKTDIAEGTISGEMVVSDYILDVKDILNNYIRITKVECPANKVPMTIPTYDVVGNYIVFRGADVYDVGDNIRLYYTRAYNPPTSSEVGDYPQHLHDAVIIGATGQSLIFKAEELTRLATEYLRQSASEVEGIEDVVIDTELGDRVVPEFPTAPVDYTGTIPTLNLNEINSLIGDVESGLATAIGVLDKAVESLGYDGTDINASYINKIESLIKDAYNTDGVSPTGLLADASDILTEGKPLINNVNVGKDAGMTFANYATVKLNQAMALIQAAGNYTSLVSGGGDSASKLAATGKIYSESTNSTISLIDRLLAIYQAQLNKSQLEIEKYNTNTEIYGASITKANAQVNYYVAQQNDDNIRSAIIARAIENNNIKLVKAKQYETLALQTLEVAGRYLASGQAKINEMIIMLGLKPEVYGASALTPQPSY